MSTRPSGGDFIWRPTRLAIYARDSFTCQLCGWQPRRASLLRSYVRAVRDGYEPRHGDGARVTRGLTLDHIVPVSRGGTNALHNLVTACLGCNSAKHTKSLHEYDHERSLIVRRQAKRPIDRAVGRGLCDILYPGWRQSEARRSLRRKTAPTKSAADFFTQIAA